MHACSGCAEESCSSLRAPRASACVLNASKSATLPGFRGGTRAAESAPVGLVAPLECGEQRVSRYHPLRRPWWRAAALPRWPFSTCCGAALEKREVRREAFATWMVKRSEMSDFGTA